jgi:hypothetical protein
LTRRRADALDAFFAALQGGEDGFERLPAKEVYDGW